MKVVINRCYGGFGISNKAGDALVARGWSTTGFNDEGNYEDPEADLLIHDNKARGGMPAWPDSFSKYGFARVCENDEGLRTHPDLVAVVETLGNAASGTHAELKVVEIPDGTDFVIEVYDGMEWVAERHQTWS